MWEEIIRVAAGNGLWALMFCVLFIHQLKDSKKREEKYTETIGILGDRLKVVNEIKKDTEDIKRRAFVKKKGAAEDEKPVAEKSAKELKPLAAKG